MRFSHSYKTIRRILIASLLAALMLASLCLSTGAAGGNNGLSALLTLDPAAMGSTTGSDSNFSWKAGGDNYALVSKTLDDYSGKVLQIGPAQFVITDTNKILAGYQAVSFSADLYFEAFPTKRAESTDPSTPDPTSEDFKPQSVIAWLGSSYDGLRIDSEGNLYSDTSKSSALDIKLEKNTWYNIKLVYSQSTDKLELWLDGARVATTACYHRDESTSLRFFDATYRYTAYAKSIEIAATEDYYYSGLNKEESADFISYQTTMPDESGKFDLRVITGIDSLVYDRFGYRVLVITKNANGHIAATEYTGTDTKVYSSVYGGETAYSIKENFGYNYAGLATLTDLDDTMPFTELVIFPYTLSTKGNKIYGDPISLSHTAGSRAADGYPAFHFSSDITNLTATDDTYIDYSYPETTFGSETQFIVRNTGSYKTGGYRASYFKFHIPAETVDQLSSMTSISLRVYVGGIESRSGRTVYPMAVYGVNQAWEEETLTYYTLYTKPTTSWGSPTANANARTDKIDEIAAEDYYAGSYLVFNVLEYVKARTPNDDGSIDVSFCVTQPDGYSDAAVVYLRAKEAGKDTAPTLRFEQSLYNHGISNAKTENNGYEPLSYAEALVDEWFNTLRSEIYLAPDHDELGNFAPEGYASATPTGDFVENLPWKGGSAWDSTNTDGDYILSSDTWSTDKWGRTLATLGRSKADEFLDSAYAAIKTVYDVYGGISNSGIKGEATGYFHMESKNGRPYIIDPLGNPYFAVSINQVNLGDSANHKTYSLAKYTDEATYFESITASLKEMGINTAFVSDDNALLAVDGGLNTVVAVSGIGAYMTKIGHHQIREGVYPYNNTLNVFDPDFTKLVNERNATLITSNGYANNANIFAYASDNELPAGDTLLERYLTLDAAVPENSFSYHTAWEWLARRLDKLNPSLSDYTNAANKAEINSEFLSFLYSHYYKTVKNSIEAVDQNHMYLGSRAFDTCKTDKGYLKAAGYYLDIITLNLYDGLNPNAATISGIYKYSGKPFIVTEFFAKAMDAIDANGYKLANSTGAGILVNTQEDRADYYESYVLNLLEAKSCVGWSWYRFRDNDQSLWETTYGGTTYEDLRMLYVYYSVNSYPITLMDGSGNVYALSDIYDGNDAAWRTAFTETYKGEGIASNQNVNKGIYNSNFASTVTVYTYKADGTLDTTSDSYSMGSQTYEIEDPSSETATTFTAKDGTRTFTAGIVTNPDGSMTKTVLTAYKGKYIELASSMKNISDNIMGLVSYFDAN